MSSDQSEDRARRDSGHGRSTRGLLAPLCLLSLLLTGPGAGAQTPELLPEFWITNDSVNAITSGPDDVYVGGDFNWVGPYTGTTVRIGQGSGVASAPYPRANGDVYAVAPDGAGGWYFGGAFTMADGVPRERLAHVLADGRLSSLSLTFAPAGARVYALAVSGDRVYVGGSFNQINGTDRNGIAALDAATGALLPWDPDAGNLGFVFSVVPAGGTVYLGGTFSTMGGLSRPNLAEVDVATDAPTSWNPGPNERVFGIALEGNTAYVGGRFTWVGGQIRNYVAAVDRTTGAATGWNPNADWEVRSIAPDGAVVYVAGYYNNIGGVAREGLAAVSAATGLATSWDPIGSPAISHTFNIVKVAGSHVFVGGQIEEVAGQPRSDLAAIDATTGLPTAWNPGASDEVWALEIQGGWVFAGGEFGGAGGQVRNHLAAFDRTSGHATGWDPDADNDVEALVIDSSQVYATGLFNQVGGLPRAGLAALDLAGAVVPSWDSSVSAWPRALATSTTDLLVGGTFTLLDGMNRQKIGSVTLADGSFTAWNPGSFTATAVNTFQVLGSTVYVGGDFDFLGGSNRSNIAQIDLTVPTNNALPFNPGASGQVNALALEGGTLFVGGAFTNLAGQSRNRIGAVDAASGAIVGTFDPNANSPVYSLATNGSTVFVGGIFSAIGGQVRNRLASLDPVTGAAGPWDPNAGATVFALDLAGNQLFVGGIFEWVSGTLRRGFAAYCVIDAPTSLVATASASPNEIDLSWTGGAPGYRVYRSRTPGVGYELIGQTATNTFTDDAAEGGIPYYYVVRAVDQCESGPSNEDTATATGGCALPPDFEGLAWARPGIAVACSVELGWAAATSPCGGSVEYTVHRDSDAHFIPSDSNRLATVTSTTFADTFSLAPGVPHYYVVRAATTAGDAEDNLVRHSAAAPGGCTATLVGIETLAATATDQNVKLQWKNPPGQDTVLIHADSSDPCVFPSDPLPTAGTYLTTQVGAAPGGVESWDHPALTNGTTYCYSVFVYDGVSEYSGPANVRSRPFDDTGKVKWAYSTGASSLAPPGIGTPSVIVVSNDRVVHSLTRGAGGGEWPAGWIPPTLGGPVQARPPVIPSPVIPAATRFALLGSQDGSAYAIDADNGAELWKEALNDVVQPAPAGVFSAFGSSHDFVLVGSRDLSGNGVFHLLNADDGTEADSFDNQPPGLGVVSGQATVDYANDRVYFGSRDGGDGKTLWCLEFGTGVFVFKWGVPVGEVDGSPVVRDDRVYVGNVDGEVHAVDADTGAALWGPAFATGDGQPKGFVFPDRASDDLYFATNTLVWGLSDLGGLASQNFSPIALPGGATPSTLLFVPGTSWLYIGGSDGRLYQVDVTGPTLDQVTLGDGGAVIGAPTLDRGVVPSMVYVGSDEGVVYGVETPLP